MRQDRPNLSKSTVSKRHGIAAARRVTSVTASVTASATASSVTTTASAVTTTSVTVSVTSVALLIKSLQLRRNVLLGLSQNHDQIVGLAGVTLGEESDGSTFLSSTAGSSNTVNSLSIRTDLVDNLTDLGLESHIQHSVGLVQNQVGHSSEVGATRVQHVQKTARRGNTDFCSSGKISHLLALRNSSVDTGVSDSGRTSELGALFLDLNRQFSGWSQDQTNRTIARLQKGLGIDVHNSRQTVRQSLTGTCRSNTHHVASRKGHWPSLTLDGSRVRKSLSLHLL
ncbi:hypothetical protein OGAPHI_005094 [Ogataea philodendri]|uniref:Uncharacterized protein n=1 Tax=Ogataea philodendri TaxID=1378263 RepID=A0A9P8T2C2_9ASCO|nr:uncharacterized protein OGAPHI_005094 [Ogataea philodendri]KAH3663693.1 hypothetical protein OGAPHI_005094 [Ogataea philodendri]